MRIRKAAKVDDFKCPTSGLRLFEVAGYGILHITTLLLTRDVFTACEAIKFITKIGAFKCPKVFGNAGLCTR